MVFAQIKTLCYKVRGASKGMPKHVPKALQNKAWHVPKPSKIETRGGPERSNAAKRRLTLAQRRPRVPRKRPRGTQEARKRDQEPAKSAPKLAKKRPRASQTLPKWSLTSPKPSFAHDRRGKRSSTGLRNDFLSFCSCSQHASCA